ncbi:hypothetical protein OG455_32980 [Kitasatospora sp. NBC_01287]|uniref:hypothetical protein n=1 Tax=Kitasatospora sp. NBC_01287 TaxID=2903573 RepID=UPI002253750C|nr:hypothetical protein [Kitasatospora sp. NBC_01287]MCX4750274.1 hypothetical protein [Kitasatospora sp. NBC_01287]
MTFTTEEYLDELSYLNDYVRDDWLGFSVITGSAAKLLGDEYSRPAERELCLRLIRDLLSEGARAGDLSADPDHPFLPWESDAAGSLTRIRAELEALGKSPDSGDVCWFSAD